MEAGRHGGPARPARAGAGVPAGGRLPLPGARPLQSAAALHGPPRRSPILQKREPRQRQGQRGKAFGRAAAGPWSQRSAASAPHA
eukprot:2278154-Alexandrium_andersonii.AAC.1